MKVNRINRHKRAPPEYEQQHFSETTAPVHAFLFSISTRHSLETNGVYSLRQSWTGTKPDTCSYAFCQYFRLQFSIPTLLSCSPHSSRIGRDGIVVSEGRQSLHGMTCTSFAGSTHQMVGWGEDGYLTLPNIKILCSAGIPADIINKIFYTKSTLTRMIPCMCHLFVICPVNEPPPPATLPCQ